MTAKSTDPTIKIVVFGSSGVGKSGILEFNLLIFLNLFTEVVAQFFPPETCVQEGYYVSAVVLIVLSSAIEKNCDY